MRAKLEKELLQSNFSKTEPTFLSAFWGKIPHLWHEVIFLGSKGSGIHDELQTVNLCLWTLVHSFVICFHQGLSAATKDTYDALHMQTLPPR